MQSKSFITPGLGILISALSFLLIFITQVTWASPPQINSIAFQDQLEPKAIGHGKISFSDPDRDVLYAVFDVADGRYHRIFAPADLHQTAGENIIPFSLSCTSFSQQITLAVTLFDQAGEQSTAEPLVFNCGEPPRYNFNLMQAQYHPIDRRLPVRLFIIDDGQTALVRESNETNDSTLRLPDDKVVDAIKNVLLPRLTGIWDQCGLGFQYSGAWVVNSEDIGLPDGTLASRLFPSQMGVPLIEHSRAVGDTMRLATKLLAERVAPEESSQSASLNVFIVGSRIRVGDSEEPDAYSEGFAEAAWPNNYIVVRWGSLLQNVVPKQMIATLSHEIGHLLGLSHSDEDGLPDIGADAMNLMLGSGVTPQPRAHLTGRQCELARKTLENLKEQMEAASKQAQLSTPRADNDRSPHLAWLSGCEALRCTGVVSLKVTATDFDNLESFGVASFAYSANGKDFIEIALDRDYSDGFSATWDSRTLPNGRYLLRVTVLDRRGNQASLEAEVLIEN